MIRIAAIVVFVLVAPVRAVAEPACGSESVGDQRYTVCRLSYPQDDIQMFAADPGGRPYGQFRPLAERLRKNGKTLVLAMNGGMYGRDLGPIGLFIENGRTIQSANTNPGPGNFHMLPNGVFYLTADRAGVMETRAFVNSGIAARFATQSGPLLLTNGKRHPRFIKGSDSRKIRNGVCATDGGRTVFLVVSETRVNFWDFSTYFATRLDCRDALSLDGTISSLYAPAMERHDGFFPLGPIIGIVADAPG